MEQEIAARFALWKGKEAESIRLLPASGSHRRYYRITLDGESLLGVYNDNLPENRAYFSFTRQFREQGLDVPRILHIDRDETVYFVEDLGDRTLFSLLPRPWGTDYRQEEAYAYYPEVIRQLIRFQNARIDYDHVYPVAEFDSVPMMWDLNYFKYFFLKLSGLEFSETALEKDFRNLCRFLDPGGKRAFLYRDFQSRNIMINNGKPWFIDFQGGRKGPLGYDLASLLYDAKADLPFSMREELLDFYIEEARTHITGFENEAFRNEFHACVLLRILQAMGTYGLRGFHEKKDLFLKSIPFAIRNLNHLRTRNLLPLPLPELERIIKKLEDTRWASFQRPSSAKLHIGIFSFSIKNGKVPTHPQHGGGFVFDCRFLPNPGRIEAYKQLTGRHPEIIRFLSACPEVSEFLQNCLQVVKPAIENYIERDFDTLSIGFGCTGGQHRSVYCAQEMARLLHQDFDVQVNVTHLAHPE